MKRMNLTPAFLLALFMISTAWPALADSYEPPCDSIDCKRPNQRMSLKIGGWSYGDDEEKYILLAGKTPNDYSGIALGVEWETMARDHFGLAFTLLVTSKEKNSVTHPNVPRTTIENLEYQLTTLDFAVSARYHTAERFDEFSFYAGGGFDILISHFEVRREYRDGRHHHDNDPPLYDESDEAFGLHLILGVHIPIHKHFAIGFSDRLVAAELADTEMDISNNLLAVEISLIF